MTAAPSPRRGRAVPAAPPRPGARAEARSKAAVPPGYERLPGRWGGRAAVSHTNSITGTGAGREKRSAASKAGISSVPGSSGARIAARRPRGEGAGEGTYKGKDGSSCPILIAERGPMPAEVRRGVPRCHRGAGGKGEKEKKAEEKEKKLHRARELSVPQPHTYARVLHGRGQRPHTPTPQKKKKK